MDFQDRLSVVLKRSCFCPWAARLGYGDVLLPKEEIGKDLHV